MNVVLPITVVLLMVVLQALYVAAEFAVVSSRRSTVQDLQEQGVGGAATLQKILSDPRRLDGFVAACQVGITLSSLVLGAYGQAQLSPLLLPFFERFGGLQQAAATTVSTLVLLVVLTALQVVLGELLPKTVALRYPEKLALFTLKPMQISLWLFHPLIRLFNGSAFAIMRKMKVQTDSGHSHVHSPEELEMLFTESARGGMIDADERRLLQGVFSLSDKNIREIMVPRVRINGLNVDQTVAAALETARRTPHTRLLVFEGNIDRVIGTVHVKDLYFAHRRNPSTGLKNLVRPVLILPDVLTVQNTWKQMRGSKHILVVLTDEYGGTSGLVTREDILEEVFGEVQDEFDQQAPLFQPQGNSTLVRGDASIHTVNNRLDLNLPDEDAYTLSGLIWAELEHPPVVGNQVEFEDAILQVEAVEGKQVTRVKITPRVQDLLGGEA